MGNPFKRSATSVDPFTGAANENVIDPLTGEIGSFFDSFDIDSIQPVFDQTTAQSLLQGSQGYLGQAGGLFTQGSNALMGNANGANNFLSSVLDPSFTDLTNNAQVQGVLDAMVNQGQRGFNIGADQISASAAGTSGGLGSSTAKTDSLSRLGADISNQLSDSTANFLQGELARRQGLQSMAAQQSLADRLGLASAYGNLGQGLGSLGLGQGSLAQGIGNLAYAQNMMPLDLMFRLGGLLKSGQSVAQPSIWDSVKSVAETGGQIGSAIATGGQTGFA